MPITIKNCGLNSAHAVEAAIVSGANFLGFIHYPDSPRHAEPMDVQNWLKAHGRAAKIVAVMVNPSDTLLQEVISNYSPTHLQLHGDESPERIESIKHRFGLPIIKAIAIENATDIQRAHDYESYVEFLLLDTKAPTGQVSGGTGKSFDWSLLEAADFEIPVFLSGGLNAENIEDALRITKAHYIDISSGLESSRGVKDAQKIKQFNAKVRDYETR